MLIFNDDKYYVSNGAYFTSKIYFIELDDIYIIKNIAYDNNLTPLPINRQIYDYITMSWNLCSGVMRGIAWNLFTSTNNNKFITRQAWNNTIGWYSITSLLNLSYEPTRESFGTALNMNNSTRFCIPASTNCFDYDKNTGNIYAVRDDDRISESLILKIDDNNFYGVLNWSDSGRIYFFNKQFADTWLFYIGSNIQPIIQYIGSNKPNAYYFATSYNDRHRILLLNPSNNTYSVISDKVRSGSYKCGVSHPVNDYPNENNIIFYRFEYLNNRLVPFLINIDKSTNTVSLTQIELNEYYSIPNLPNSEAVGIMPFIHKYNNELYLSVVIMWLYSNQISATNLNNISRIITYKINPDNYTLTYITDYIFSDTITGIIIADNIEDIRNIENARNRLILMGNNGTYLTNFNGNSWLNNTYPYIALAIAVDKFDRIFIKTNTGQLYLLAQELPLNVVIKPEKQVYDFVGNEINTYIDVDVFNYQNERLSITGDLILQSSNVVFLDNTKIKTITTSNSQSTRVPIKIIDGGNVLVKFALRLGL